MARGAAGIGAALAALALFGPRNGAVLTAALAPAAVILVRQLQSKAATGFSPEDLVCLPLVLDLIGLALASGQPLDAALLAAAPSARPQLAGQLNQVAGLLRLGAEPAQAWHGLTEDARLRPVAVTAIRSAGSGIRLAGSFADLAIEQRAASRAVAEARAQRAGVWAIAPLGLCFLPAFVCLGIVPVVIGVAGGILQNVNP